MTKNTNSCLDNPDNVMDIWKYKFQFDFNSLNYKFEEHFLSKTPFEKTDYGRIFVKKQVSFPDGIDGLSNEYYSDFVCDAMIGSIVVDSFSVSTIMNLSLYSDKKLDKNLAEKMFLEKISKKIENDIHKLDMKKYKVDLMIEGKGE